MTRTDQSVAVTDIIHRTTKVDFDAFMHHRRVIDDGIRFDESMKRMEDWDFMIQLCRAYPDGLLYIPEILYTYIQKFGGDGVVSKTDYEGWADVMEYVYNKHKDYELMDGQDWYPRKVEKWRAAAEAFAAGEAPPYYLHYFKDHWSK